MYLDFVSLLLLVTQTIILKELEYATKYLQGQRSTEKMLCSSTHMEI